MKRQIIALSNRSVEVEDRHKMLRCACALYDIALIKASQSTNAEVCNLILDFSPVAALLKKGGKGWIERLRIHFQIESVKKKYLDGLKGTAKEGGGNELRCNSSTSVSRCVNNYLVNREEDYEY